MTNSQAKGDRRERQAVDIYEAAGYAVERATGGGSHSPDFFDEYDLIAMREGEDPLLAPGPVIRLVQVRSNGASGVEAWSERVVNHIGNDIQPEMAVPYDRDGWRLIHPRGEGYETVYDERDGDCKMGDGLAEWLREGGDAER